MQYGERGGATRLGATRNLTTPADAGYQLRISYETEDPEWDAFLAETPGGHHVQTSLWGQVKALLGWRAARVMVTRDEQIVAGAQLLIRPLPLVGAIGYVPKGPLFALGDPRLRRLMMDELHRLARDHRIQYIVVQPPCHHEALASQLPDWGFRLSSVQIMPTATVLLDLSMDLDDILAQMKLKTRQNVRRAQRQGITVREGTEQDLAIYYRLLTATSRRQNFSIYPEEYFSKMWRVFDQHGYIKLFLAEYEGEVVSAQLVVPFGDTVLNKLSVWSGRHGSHRPNEALQWSTIRWGKAQGFGYYDFEGISSEAAKAVMHGEALPDSLTQTVASFKLGFGGQVCLCPEAYDYVYNPLLRLAYTTVVPRMVSLSALKNAMNRLRTSRGGPDRLA